MDTSLLSQSGLFTHPGFIGGMIGAVVGLLGGVFGATCSYRKAMSERERQWILFYSISIIVLCVAGAWTLLAVQATQRMYFQIGFQVLLWPMIVACVFHLNHLHRRGNT